MSTHATPVMKIVVFECPWCHSMYAADEFSYADLREGPLCPVCGEMLERQEAVETDPRLGNRLDGEVRAQTAA